MSLSLICVYFMYSAYNNRRKINEKLRLSQITRSKEKKTVKLCEKNQHTKIPLYNKQILCCDMMITRCRNFLFHCMFLLYDLLVYISFFPC